MHSTPPIHCLKHKQQQTTVFFNNFFLYLLLVSMFSFFIFILLKRKEEKKKETFGDIYGSKILNEKKKVGTGKLQRTFYVKKREKHSMSENDKRKEKKESKIKWKRKWDEKFTDRMKSWVIILFFFSWGGRISVTMK